MANDDSTPAWVDRPGPIGSREEQRWYEEVRGVSPPDPLWQVRRILREIASGTPASLQSRERDHLGGFVLADREVSRLEVLSALARLDDGTRADGERNIVVLAFLRGLRRADIAKCAGCSVSTVYRRLRAGLGRMVAVIWDYQPSLPAAVLEAMIDDDGPTVPGSCLGCGMLPSAKFVEGYCPGCYRRVQRAC